MLLPDKKSHVARSAYMICSSLNDPQHVSRRFLPGQLFQKSLPPLQNTTVLGAFLLSPILWSVGCTNNPFFSWSVNSVLFRATEGVSSFSVSTLEISCCAVASSCSCDVLGKRLLNGHTSRDFLRMLRLPAMSNQTSWDKKV